MQAALAVMAALIGRGGSGPGAHLDVSDRRRGAVADLARRRRAPGHRRRGRPGARHRHRPLRLLRHLPRPPTAGGWPSGRSSPSSSPTSAGCSAASSGSPTSSTTRSRTRSGPTSGRPSPPGTATPGWQSWPAPTPVSPRCCRCAELVDDEPVSRPVTPSSRPSARPTGRTGQPVPPGRPGAGRHGGARRAGGRAATRPVPTPTSCSPRPASTAARIAELRDEGGGGMSAIGDRRHRRGADRGRAVRGGGRVPGRAGLRLDHLLLGGERQPALLGRPGRRRR